MAGDAKPSEGFPENSVIYAGYHALLAERYGFNDDLGKCRTQESGFFYEIERTHLEIPEGLRWGNIENEIDPLHRKRMERVWEELCRAQKKWKQKVNALKKIWESAPLTGDMEADQVIAAMSEHIHFQFRKAAVAIATFPEEDGEGDETLVGDWKNTEDSARNAYYDANRNYITALRIYYELLLEQSEKKEDSTPLVIQNPELRQTIAVENRFARLIQAVHQAIAAAKATHHKQPGKRVRKTVPLPYIAHPIQATGAAVLDVAPHVIEETPLPHDLDTMSNLIPIHDLREDSELEEDTIVEDQLARLADTWDSQLNPIIKSGFETPPERLKKKWNILGGNRISDIRIALRVLSNNEKLAQGREEKTAIEQNILGVERTFELLGRERPRRGDLMGLRWLRGLGITSTKEPSKMVQRFPTSYNEKMDLFLMKAMALTSGTRRQQIFLAKLEDQADNLKDLAGMRAQNQLTSLRAVTTRLIAWMMLDNNTEKFPLYNALPRLIDIAIAQYERVIQEFPEELIDEDEDYLNQLEIWAVEVRRWEVPEKVQAVLDRYNSAQPAAAA